MNWRMCPGYHEGGVGRTSEARDEGGIILMILEYFCGLSVTNFNAFVPLAVEFLAV